MDTAYREHQKERESVVIMAGIYNDDNRYPLVSLVAYVNNPITTIINAAGICYNRTPVNDDQSLTKKDYDFLNSLHKSGHLSPFEHVNFTFRISKISRACSHQLVRHRIASFSQQSQRYVKEDECRVVTPISILNNPDALAKYNEAINMIYKTYSDLISIGILAEDARFILPNAAETDLYMTMNVRELYHFFNLRLCNRAQWEIRSLAAMMYIKLYDIYPQLFASGSCGPDCMISRCKEKHPCSHPYNMNSGSLNDQLQITLDKYYGDQSTVSI